MICVGLVLGLVTVGVVTTIVGGRPLPEYEVEEPQGAEPYFREDPELGTVPAPGVRVRSSRELDGEVLYDVEYTIDENGLRAVPGSGDTGPAVLFFGGSFTFGEGVEDDESLPASLASWLRDDTRILNAGFHGYGPHQMLRSLETHRLDALVPEGVEYVVYQGIGGHVMRAAGRAAWDLGGPEYVVGSDGEVSFVGPFRSGATVTAAKMLNRLGPLRPLFQWSLLATEAERQADRERYVEIVARSAELVRERWGARFTVVFWDHDGDEVATLLRERGLDVLLVSDALEGKSWRRFVLKGDRHPSRVGHRRVAKALTRHLRKSRRIPARTDPK